MSQHSDNFLDETIKFWQPRVQHELSREDARQIVENLSGFFQLLRDWDAQQHRRDDIVPCGVSDGGGELPMPSSSSKLKALTSPTW